MSSGFVSGGTIDNPAERDDAWRAAQQELEANRQQREEASTANDGKSLYDVLQANKGGYLTFILWMSREANILGCPL